MSETNQINLSMQDNGSTIKPETGTTIVVSLESNPTTGYTWAISAIDTTIIQSVKQDFNGADTSTPGAGGQQYFTFKTLKKGSSKLSLKYYRKWQSDSSAVKTFEVNVEVI